MTLTVPKAGVDPGRVARTQPKVVDQTGANIARLGAAIEQVAVRVETDRLEREYQRNTTDLTRDMNNLRLEVAGIGDPDQATARWAQGRDALRSQYLGDETGGAGQISAGNRDRFGIAFDNLANGVEFSIGRQALAARQSQHEANYIAYAHEATRHAAASDIETRQELLTQGQDMIDNQVALGVIDAAEGARRKAGLKADIDNARAIELARQAPEDFLASVDGGDFKGLDAERLAHLKNQANAQLQANAAAEARDRAAAVKAAEKQLDSELTEITDIYGTGRIPANEALLDNPAAQQRPGYARAAAAQALFNERPDLQTQTVSQLRDVREEEANRRISRKWQNERLELIDGMIADLEAGYREDPINQAQSVGLNVAELPEFDAQDPSEFVGALRNRLAQGEWLVEQGYTGELRAFTNEERETLKRLASTESDPATRASLAAALTAGTAGSQDRVSQWVADPVFAHVGGLQVSGGSPQVAQEILRGQQIIEQGNAAGPSKSDRRDPAFSSFENLFADLPNGEATQRSILDATDALYVTRVRREDPNAEFDEDLYAQALHEVMGGTGTAGRSDAAGGVQDINGVPTILPRGVTLNQFDDAMASIGRTPQPVGRRSVNRLQFDDAAFDVHMRAISNSRSFPTVGGEPVMPDDLRRMTLRSIGDDKYVFVQPTQEGPLVVYGDDDAPFVFSLRRMIDVVSR